MKPPPPSAAVRLFFAVCAIIILGAFALAGGALYGRFADTNSRRAQQQAFNDEVLRTWHIVLCGLEQDSAGDPSSTGAERRRASAFLDRALSEIHAPPCTPVKGAQ